MAAGEIRDCQRQPEGSAWIKVYVLIEVPTGSKCHPQKRTVWICLCFVLFFQKAIFKIEHSGDPRESSKEGGVKGLVAPKLSCCHGHRNKESVPRTQREREKVSHLERSTELCWGTQLIHGNLAGGSERNNETNTLISSTLPPVSDLFLGLQMVQTQWEARVLGNTIHIGQPPGARQLNEKWVCAN